MIFVKLIRKLLHFFADIPEIENEPQTAFGSGALKGKTLLSRIHLDLFRFLQNIKLL